MTARGQRRQVGVRRRRQAGDRRNVAGGRKSVAAARGPRRLMRGPQRLGGGGPSAGVVGGRGRQKAAGRSCAAGNTWAAGERWTVAAGARPRQVGSCGWSPAVRRAAGSGWCPAPGGRPLAGERTGGVDLRRLWVLGLPGCAGAYKSETDGRVGLGGRGGRSRAGGS